MARWDRSTRGHDTGDVIAAWMVQVATGLAIVGVVTFDALSVGSSWISIEDHAATAARAAADNWASTRNNQSAFNSAWESANEANTNNYVDPKSFVIDPAGQAHVSLSREAPTFVMRHIGPLRRWALVRSNAVSRAPTG